MRLRKIDDSHSLRLKPEATLQIMQIAEVVGTVVSTQKNHKLEGAKLLLVQPLTLEGTPRGTALLAIDAVGAGVGEKVLVVIEGKAAGDALGRKAAAVDAAIIGIVDSVDCRGDAYERGCSSARWSARRSPATSSGGTAAASRRRPDAAADGRSHASHFRYALPESGGPA